MDSERRLDQRSKPLPGQRDLAIKYQAGTGPSVMAAKLSDFGEDGMSVEIDVQLAAGLVVEVVGDIQGENGSEPLAQRGHVVWCSPAKDGKFAAGVTFLVIPDSSASASGAKGSDSVDYYEILQLSRNASPDTIQRVFRMLAKRYHPDNPETGNPELFRQVVEAARVLSDPQARAAYDARLGVQSRNRFKIFESWRTSRGVEAEKRKRKGILALLYGRRLTDPHQPQLSIYDMEEMLDCPREHLEFAIWFLKESKWIRGFDNGYFEITCQGVLMAEEDSEGFQPPLPQLTAPKDPV